MRTTTDSPAAWPLGQLGLVDQLLVAVEVIALAAGTDLRLRGPGAPRGDAAAEVHERLVHADDVVTDRAARSFHETALSVRVSHFRWRIGHPFPWSIR
jgi:hypothetical protein